MTRTAVQLLTMIFGAVAICLAVHLIFTWFEYRQWIRIAISDMTK